MALTFEKVLREAEAIESMANEVVAMHSRIKQLIAHNSDLAIDWNAVELPAYITEDAAGNILGMLYSRAAVSNTIFSLLQLSNVLENETVVEGDHLGNFNALAKPVASRITVRS